MQPAGCFFRALEGGSADEPGSGENQSNAQVGGKRGVKIAKNCKKVSKNCKKMKEVVKNCRKLQENAKNCEKVSFFAHVLNRGGRSLLQRGQARAQRKIWPRINKNLTNLFSHKKHKKVRQD